MTVDARHLLLCRPGFEATLCDELQASQAAAEPVDHGLVRCDAVPAGLIFARQVLPHAACIAPERLKPIADDTLDALLAGVLAAPGRWTTHAMAQSEDLHRRVDGIERTVLRLAARRHPSLERLYRPPHRAERMDDARVLQLCLGDRGLWYSVAGMDTLLSRQPGGVLRMKDDPQAPSRSYLKIEEAFAEFREWPQAGQSVVDLGAAPGGWSWAFLKRGCHVLAVDNGPMKLPAAWPDGARLEHRRVDGVSFQPQRPVDWLVADMLVAPGVALGLLKRWIGGSWMRRFVVNVKLPQEKPYPALAPIQSLLASQPPGFSYRIRQLFHDRREVTVLGRMDSEKRVA